MKYIDAHCHLNFPQYREDLQETIKRAADLDVGMIIVGTTLETSKRAVEIATVNKNIWAIIGMHPIRVHEESFHYEEFLSLAKNPKVVGVGECGFDFFQPNVASFEKQREVFESQIKIALQVKKPLMLHLRSSKDGSENAYKSALKVLESYQDDLAKTLPLSGDAHFFAGSKEELRAFLDKGFCISFTGVITFTQDYNELVRMVPQDRLLSETDAPFVPPVPHRKLRNEPVFVTEIAHKIAEIRGESRDELLPNLVNNAKRLFSLKN